MFPRLDISAALEEHLRHDPTMEASRALADSLTKLVSTGQDILPTLRTALQDAARQIDRVGTAVTGLGWAGAGAASVEQELLQLIRGANCELAICAYSVSGAALPMLREIEAAVSQGLLARIVVNELGSQPDPVRQFLEAASRSHPGRFDVYSFSDLRGGTQLHAKVAVADRARAIVGSANLSFRGMSSSHEMAFMVNGPAAAIVASRLDLLFQSPLVQRI